MALNESIREIEQKVLADSASIAQQVGIRVRGGNRRGRGNRVLDVSGRQGDRGWTVLMVAPTVCPECSGRGWRLYRVETIEGEEEWAWELCQECEGGDAFPPK